MREPALVSEMSSSSSSSEVSARDMPDATTWVAPARTWPEDGALAFAVKSSACAFVEISLCTGLGCATHADADDASWAAAAERVGAVRCGARGAKRWQLRRLSVTSGSLYSEASHPLFMPEAL